MIQHQPFSRSLSRFQLQPQLLFDRIENRHVQNVRQPHLRRGRPYESRRPRVIVQIDIVFIREAGMVDNRITQRLGKQFVRI